MIVLQYLLKPSFEKHLPRIVLFLERHNFFNLLLMKHQRHFEKAKELAKTMIKLDSVEVMKPVKNAVLNNFMRFNFPYFEIIDREFMKIY